MSAMEQQVSNGFTHHVLIGSLPGVGQIFVTIRYTNDGKLSLTGVEGPGSNGDARGPCGQIIIGFKEYDARGYETLSDITPADGWTPEAIRQLFDTWEQWSGNDLTPGCEHQRAEGWSNRPIDPSKPTTAYGKHFEGQRSNSWNMLTWATRAEHPGGLLSFPCPTCGYKYGTAWLKREVPSDVVEWLRALPTSDALPTRWQS